MPTPPPTTGPWTVQRRPRRGAIPAGWQVRTRNAVLAELTCGSARAHAETAANARLMAAAPRLAASLRVLSLLLHRHFAAAPSGPRPDRRLMLAACAAADAVLAEAGDDAAETGPAATR
jgi:hypothetical protein